ncbi:MAG TPA: tRNA preQ1(34) S-adenosylmethionine ribosyltransferase-isomerase QueA [Planctomycetota bacterium]|nr:tRNA preQ1(34) S-adenosylmethionine ribosyltransferase-isomerase QueA [Planctomycetota bacterium]
MQTALFDFHLPEQLVAQEPLADRDASRLMVLNRAARTWSDRAVRDLPSILRPGDLLVVNNTRVIPARLRATRDSSGGKVEFLLLPPSGEISPAGRTIRRVLTKSGGKLKTGETFTLTNGPKVTLLERHGEAGDVIEIAIGESEFNAYVLANGEVPLPPYIRRDPGPSSDADRQRYQTVFAQTPGAVAAPTAGLHFSERLLAELKDCGVQRCELTLHVGPGTFRPVKADRVEDHFVDPEPFTITAASVAAIAAAKREGRRVIAVGTTSLRALEGGLAPAGILDTPRDFSGSTNLFVHPPYTFRIADGLLTNFHIPKSSLLMLICAFAAPGSTDGIEFVKRAYEHAVAEKYRFYSYGDACLIV